MKLIVSGPRDAGNEHVERVFSVLDFFNKCNVIDQIFEGGADGIDFIARQWAKDNGYREIKLVNYVTNPLQFGHGQRCRVTFPADWDKYKKAAGPIRNRQMAEMGDALVAFWDGRYAGCGTYNMIEQMRGMNKPILIEYISINS